MSQNKFIIFGMELNSKSPKLHIYTDDKTGNAYLDSKEVVNALHNVFCIEYEKILIEMINDEIVVKSKTKDELIELTHQYAEKGDVQKKLYNIKNTDFKENFGVEISNKRSSLCVIVYYNAENNSLKDVRNEVLDFVNDCYY